MRHLPKQCRWWGWGYADHHYPETSAQRFITVLHQRLDPHTLLARQAPVALDAVQLPPSRLPQPFIEAWQSKGLDLTPAARVTHAAGKSYRDLLRLRSGRLERHPDGVLFLERAEDLPRLFADCTAAAITLIPFGGGTGVVGGTECLGRDATPVLVVNLTALNRLVALDPVSQTATFEAGILGPDLEHLLNAAGYTLGHFPQSFEFSTLGGWIVTRSAGQNSTHYGKIEDLVVSLKLYTPQGVLETKPVPSAATGPALNELMIGSEGTFGILTHATVKISKQPERERFVSAFFKDFATGATCIRHMIQSGIEASVIRLSDASETELLLDMQLAARWQKTALARWLRYKGLGAAPCVLIISAEGAHETVGIHARRMQAAIRNSGGALFPLNLGKKWKAHRFEHPYLRDDLMDYGFFVDTLETAAAWSRLGGLYDAMIRAFRAREERCGEKLVVGCHLSHTYPDGASLYFTLLGRQREGAELAQWQEIKTLATDTLLANGGALSHHHGIGTDHRAWMAQEQSPLGLQVLKDLKKSLDPAGLLNPGKLI